MKTKYYSSFSISPWSPSTYFLTNFRLRFIGAVRHSKRLGSKSEDAVIQLDQTEFGEPIRLQHWNQRNYVSMSDVVSTGLTTSIMI